MKAPTVPFRVNVPEPLLGELPALIRTRVWLTMARLAQNAIVAAPKAGSHGLGEGYSLSYEVDGLSRTVNLVGVVRSEQPTFYA